MAEEDDTGGYSQSQPNSNTIPLRTKEDVSKELKEWMEIGTETDGGDNKKLYDDAIQHIESKLYRPLSCLELTWTERQYVITLLQLWLEKSLRKAFEYLIDEKNDISQSIQSIILTQLNPINKFEDIRSIPPNDLTSPSLNWWDGDCRYLKLILEQEDLFKKTPRFPAFFNSYFKEFKTSCIEKVFSRCLKDIVTDTTNGEKHRKFIETLNEFLANVNEAKNLKDILDKDEFLLHNVKEGNKTGQDIIKQLVEKFNSSSETEQEGTVARQEWLQTFLSTAETLSKEKWPLKLQLLTKDICKRFLLPKTEIEFKRENGKQIISIEGVVIFVSKVIARMIDLKMQQSSVQEIEIIGWKSVHIDCDLDNDIWHGINIGITTDKLIVDDKICWDVSGKTVTTNPSRGKTGEPGESGGNVHVVCNQMINGDKWTIVSDGGDGSDCYKWTKEEFQKSFPSMSTDEANIETVLTTLQEILPIEYRTRGKDISLAHNGNFLVDGTAEDGREITVIFYGGKKGKQTLILIKGGRVGQGGYGGDITVECFTPTEVNQTHGIPFTGTDTRRKQLGAILLGVYEASGSNGEFGNMTGDVAFIHKSKAKSGSGILYGFEKNEKIVIKKWLESKPKVDTNLYVKHENTNYAKLELSSYSANDSPSVSLVDSVKKKSVIRQSLIQHFDQIEERNQSMESIHKMLSNPTEHHSSSIDEIINKMDNKVHQFNQLTIKRQKNQLEQVQQQEQYVKPAIDSSSPIPKPKIIGRRPVWNDNKVVHRLKNNSQNNVGVYCLDELLTEDGSDSLLHCLFGQINSKGKYVCKDTNKFRKRIAKCIREEKSSEKEERAKFIESPTGKLESDELEILSKIFSFKIHVYDDHFGSSCFRYFKTLPIIQSPSPCLSSHSRYYQKVDPKEIKDDEYCVLYKGDGRWRRLQPNYNLHLFCSEFSFEDDEQNCNPTYFAQLKSWIDGNKKITKEAAINTYIDKLNPQNQKTPDELSRLVFDRLNKPNMNDDNQKELVKAICSLAEWVDYYNTQNVSPFFYLTIVKKYEPQDWVREFLLLEMETRLEKPLLPLENLNPWRKEIRGKLNENQTLLLLLTKIAMDKKANDILLSLNFNKLLRMLTVCKEEKCDEGEIHHSVINLFYKHLSKIWETKVNEWLKIEDKLRAEKRKEYVNLLLEMEHRSEIKLPLTNNFEIELQNTLLQGHNLESEPEKERDVDSIIKKMTEQDPYMSENVRERVKNLFGQILPAIEEIDIPKEIETWINDSLDLNDDSALKKFLFVFDYAVEKKMKFKLRDTQKVTLIILLLTKIISIKALAQLSTGEGKSVIVAGVAIGFALSKPITKKDKRKKNKVDVITSNDVLALRDSSLLVAEGGLKELYEFFKVTVGNNCSQSVDERKMAYSSTVVYGQLANFQRDYLLDKFYDRNIRGDRRMEFVIIDEADCMLLDRGNNVLYLSHDIPCMEMLESLYVFIWEKISDTADDEIKSDVLYDLYGQITKEDLNSIHAPLGEKEFESERSEIWKHLIDKKVINRQGRLLIHNVSQISEKIINYEPINPKLKGKQLSSKIIFYFRTIIKRERRIRIPDHLMDFVDRHLDTWLDNARRALELKQDEDYVIDCDRSDKSPALNPQVIIIDQETGTDQFNSQWDGALHQFLQLKEGCKLTLQSLKAVFISNAKYMKKYDCLVGVSGTLGSEPEQEFLEKEYECNLFTIPTAVPKRFSLKSPKLLKIKECWRKAIIEETRRTIMDEKRSIVIFCQSIKEVNKVHQHLKTAIPVLKDNKNKRIHRYTRDYEKFEFESKTLDEGHVIVTTNLAGRGTNIKLSETLKANGGLHICLTYFPENERVEEQAMGRAARKGEPGSGILILCEESGISEEWDEEKIFVMKEERAWKKWQRITQLEKDFNYIEMLGNLSEESTDLISKNKIKEEISKEENNEIVKLVQQLNDVELLNVIHDNLLDNWAMWLDETDFSFKCYNIKQRELHIDLKKFIIDIPNCMTPVRKVTFAKHLAMEKSKMKGNEIHPKNPAINILNEVIHSPDNFFYPSAFYYRAFILLTKNDFGKDKCKKEKEEFIRTLRSAETILNEHIDIQIFFFSLYQSERSRPNPSFYFVDGYKEQKENNITILQCFISSIQSLLGTHYLSASDIEEKLAQLKPKKEDADRQKKADQLFKWLMESKYIECAVNDPETVPNYDDLIRKIANKYDVKRSFLEENMLTILKKVQSSANDIEKELEKENLISCSKETFWTKLTSKNGPLIDAEDIILMNDSECDDEPKLERSEKVTIDGCVQYEPKYFSQLDLEDNKKIMFTKEYVKDNLLAVDYRQRKPKFEFNKIAKINFEKLKFFDLKAFGQLTKDHLRYADFNLTERQQIWNELKEQGIIDDHGYYIPLAPEFKYSDCQIYEDVVNCLIEKTFPAEFVRRKWLEMESKDTTSEEYFDCVKSINLLPEKPHCEMLGELIASHVISGAQVAHDIDFELDVEFDKKPKWKEMTDNKKERDCIKELLKERQTDYVVTKTDNVTLKFLEGEIKTRDEMRNIWSEFHVFRLIGFDSIISIKDREKSWKTNAKAIGIIVSGGVQYAVGDVLALGFDKIPVIGWIIKLFFNFLIGDLTKTGLHDIYFGIKAFKSPNDLVFYYRRQKIKSLKESGGLVLRGGISLAQQIKKRIKKKKSQS